MNKTTLSAFAVFTSLIGCAAPDQEPSQSDDLTAGAQQDLTVSECGTQRDACFRKNPLFGLFTCPAQYTQCVATASNGIPGEVTAAIADAADCTSTYTQCVAKNPGGVAGCTAAQADCVATIVGVELPAVVDGTAGCVDDAVSCIDGSKRVSDLTNCAKDLSSCAVEQAASLVPPEVGEVIDGANQCRLDLNACVAAAETPVAIAQCTEDSATCVAQTLHVTLPNVPLDEVGDCADSATQCALDARKLSDITTCATNLTACAGKVIGDTTGVPKPLTCEQKWTACVAKNPFGFFSCGADLASCKD
jgi:hypothetical protein